jgi:plastocyanin
VWLAGPLVAAAFLLAGCGGSGGSHAAAGSTSAPAASNATIVIKNFAFHPSDLSVAPGAKVTVHNEDGVTHTVTAVAPHQGAFNTGDISAGKTVTFTAPTAAGSYPYFCLIHQFMHGTLTVK